MASDSEDDEFPFIRFGTPLEELDETEPLKKPTLIFDQIATDTEGRRRFHGAFTGGFSAGYYNTVGSKDGWTPKTFRSSRSDKTERKAYDARDFMDEEDMGEYGFAPKRIVTQSKFTTDQKKKRTVDAREKFQQNATMLLGIDMLNSLVIPVSNNIGVKLLQRMGWKPGQGIGPKLKRPKRKRKRLSKYPPGHPNAPGSEDEDFIPENMTFAPEDSVPVDFAAKDNTFGIGYTALNPKLALHDKVKQSSALSFRTKTGKKMSFVGQAFGVGAYEEDDQDIYAQDSMANYDLAMEDEKDTAYGWSKPTLAITGKKNLRKITANESKDIEGFKKAEKCTKVMRKVYPPPELPPDFDPHRRLKLQFERLRLQSLPADHKQDEVSTLQKTTSKFNRLNPDQRSKLLGEEQLKSEENTEPKSVFWYLSPADRAKLQKIKSVEKTPENQKKENEKEERKKPSISGPFVSDPAKSDRYQVYVTALKEKKDDPYSLIDVDPNMTEWEKRQEQEEFKKASRFFQPLSMTMSSRFTTESQMLKEKDEKEEQMKNATKMKMFGIMTRESVEWHPDSLLCKRFNVPNPYPNSDIVGIPGSDNKSGEMFLHPDDLKHKLKEPLPEPVEPDSDKTEMSKGMIVSDTKYPSGLYKGKAKTIGSSRWDAEPVYLGPPSRENEEPDSNDMKKSEERDKDNNASGDEKEESTSRPSIDLFKAIFASSEEEDSSSEDDDEPENESGNETLTLPKSLPESIPVLGSDLVSHDTADNNAESKTNSFLSSKANPDAGHHRFTFNSKKVISAESKNTPESNATPQTSSNLVADEDDDAFGPALPPPRSISTMWQAIDPATLRGGSSKQKKKKKKKHKHHKEDKKAKKAKRR